VADLYSLKDKKDELIAMERMAEKSVSNMLDAVESSKNRPLSRVIFALGIRHVGSETAEILTKHYHDIESLAGASEEELTEIPSIGPKIAESIVDFFRQEPNRAIIEKLKRAGVKLKEEAEAREELPLSGQEFVLTGKMETFPRSTAEARIKELGGAAGSSVTRKTTFLVVGADPGSKLDKARELGTKIITEDEFLILLEEAQK
jgi:DNA ligase (NAD+)